MPIWRAAPSTIWWDSRSRRFCGASCPARARRGGCNPWRFVWSASGKRRSRRSGRANTGTVEADFESAAGQVLRARLTHLDGKKLGTHAISDEAGALAVKARLEEAAYRIASVEKKQARRNPAPPFTTSTLQQESSRRLGFGAAHTMRLAQQLYEGVELGGESVGLITYMRTDSVVLSGEALAGVRRLIGRDFGDAYLPPKPRRHRSSARNAQEAHEAIRPTDMARRPQDIRNLLKPEPFRLYELIWKRAVASQMASAVFDRAAVDVAAIDGRAVLRATGSVIRFDGFLKLYREGHDDSPGSGRQEDEEGRVLPPVAEGEPVRRKAVEAEQHFTQPPPRYTEASLVKRLEELGIGRPSTYAAIIQVLQDRDYVRLESKRFLPEDRGRIVTAFLQNFFERYVEYEFTADLEEKLDAVSNGRIDWRALLQEFWNGFAAKVEETQELRISNVIDALDSELDAHFFPPNDNGQDPRACPVCGEGRLGLRLGRHGALLFGCSRYPDCRHVRPLTAPEGEAATGPRVLGDHPATGAGSLGAQGALRVLCAACRRGREQAEARLDPARRRSGRDRPRTGARPAGIAARSRHASGDRQADFGRLRAVRPLSCAMTAPMSPSRAARMCWRSG